jgi:patatin-like phospholipase/acyl hydrolase
MATYTPEKKYIRILALDGGGVRGILPGQMLAKLEHKLQARTGDPEKRLADYFDFFAGTGTGGILSCAYLTPVKDKMRTPRFSASQIVDFYIKYAGTIFNDTLDHKIITLGGFLDEKYNAEGLEKTFIDHFENIQLSHLLKPCAITAYDIYRRRGHLFTQHTASKPSADFYVRDVVRATSAIPTYFECKEVMSLSGVSYPLIDGSIFANNPALCAVAEASKLFFATRARKQQATLANMLILSLGTGLPKVQYSYDDVKNWGLAKWTRPLQRMSASANAEAVDYQLQQLYAATGASNQYLRINPELPVDVAADIDNVQPQNLQALKELGDATFEALEDKLDTFVSLMLEEE